MATELLIHLPKPHERQRAFIDSKAKRKVVKAGRRGGKTVGVGILAVENFLQGRRVLYAAPTQDQIDRFWETVKRALEAPIDEGVFRKNETRHIIERAGTEQRIRAKTAWNADTLRGDYADLLILDEFQLMDETAWNEVGAPMMIDTNGDAVFVYTPPSSKTRSVSKARDKRHAAKLFERAKQDTTGRWETFHFSSFDNPHLSHDALNDISQDMSALAYRQEILAEDIDEVPGALWTRSILETTRVAETPTLSRIIVAIDPAVTATSSSDETGIIVAGRDENDHGYILEDLTIKSSPDKWGKIAVKAYDRWQADMIVGETNNGGDMVGLVIRAAAKDLCDEGVRETKIVPYKQVRASRGKRTRAEPISTLYEQCLAEGTLIQTARGDVPVEHVREGDAVWTRRGPRKVLWSGQTGVESTIVLRVGKHELICTPSHPVHTKARGFLRAGLIVPNCDIITTWNKKTFAQIAESLSRAPVVAASHALRHSVGETLGNQNGHSLNFRGDVTTLILRGIGELADTGEIDFSTEIFGRARMALSPRGGISITPMAIRETTPSKTLLPSTHLPISDITETVKRPTPFPAERWMRKNAARGGTSVCRKNEHANSVDWSLSQQLRACGSALRPVTQDTGLGSVVSGPKSAVYNLMIDDQPEFFANGILVHNCRVHHVGSFPDLEDQLCTWVPGDASPDRLDAMVWAVNELTLNVQRKPQSYQG